MPYISRDKDQKINGIYTNSQEGYAEEFIDDDEQELIAYFNQAIPELLASPQTPLQARRAILGTTAEALADKQVDDLFKLAMTFQ